MRYEYSSHTGALRDTVSGTALRDSAYSPEGRAVGQLATRRIPPDVLALVPAETAWRYLVIPFAFDGETVTMASANADDIAVQDSLRFQLALDVRLVPVAQQVIERALRLNYGAVLDECSSERLGESTDSDISFASAPRRKRRAMGGAGLSAFCPVPPTADFLLSEPEYVHERGLDLTGVNTGGGGMLFYTVEDGQQALMVRPNGSMRVLVGPQRVWRGFCTFQKLNHYVAHPGEYLIVRFRNGRQEHLPGPAEVWFDPREHLEITKHDALQIAAKEAVVVYSKSEETGEIARRIEYGPAQFVPAPGEWLHTFSWHGSRGGSKGVKKTANSLVFQKLWLMPDQMYHDVQDVRTADDAVLTIRLMIFFELLDIERLLETSHDPIGDFVNAATSDIVEFTVKHNFESFKANTDQLNELATYKQLARRSEQCGYRINNVVYRGYGAADSLQQMHDQAIEARTRLQLERDTEKQAQELEDFKLESQLARAGKRRSEQTLEVEHELEMSKKRQDAEIQRDRARQTARREEEQLAAQTRLEIERGEDVRQSEHLTSLANLGVDLTSYLTQHRADRLIEIRGNAGPQLRFDGDPKTAE